VIREEVGAAAQKSPPAPVASADVAFRMQPSASAPAAEKPKGGWARFQARFKKQKQYSQI
jgi:hypothetical protein